MPITTEGLRMPDGTSDITISDIAMYDRLRVITDAHTLIAPALLVLAAVLVLVALRFGKLAQLFSLWLAAKERELKQRATAADQ